MNHRLTATAAIATVLASISLYPLVSGASWFWPGAGAAAVVGAVGTLTRRRVLPVLVCAIASLAGLLLYLNIVFAGPEALARIVPTGASLHHLWALARQGLDGTSRYSPPVPPTPGILLLTVAGVGIGGCGGRPARGAAAPAGDGRAAAAGAFLRAADCQQRTGVRSAPLAVLPGHDGVPRHAGRGRAGTAAALGAAGHRLAGRGRTTQPGSTDGPNTRELAASGRRIGLAAVVIALFVPLLVPGLTEHKLFCRPGAGAGVGGFVSLPNPLVQMNSELHRSEPANVMTHYRTADPDPQYLQVYVLDELTTTTWTLTPSAGRPAARREAARRAGDERAHDGHHVEDQRSPWPAGSPAASPRRTSCRCLTRRRRVSVAGDWRADPGTLTMFSRTPACRGSATR